MFVHAGPDPVQEVIENPQEAHKAQNVLDALDGLPWSFTITKSARQEWAGLDYPYR